MATTTILGLDVRYAFAVVQSFGSNTMSGFVRDHEDTAGDALLLARMYAEEHANRLGVPTTLTSLGASFVTNNGSTIVYRVHSNCN